MYDGKDAEQKNPAETLCISAGFAFVPACAGALLYVNHNTVRLVVAVTQTYVNLEFTVAFYR